MSTPDNTKRVLGLVRDCIHMSGASDRALQIVVDAIDHALAKLEDEPRDGEDRP
jgi:hypothetical protein